MKNKKPVIKYLINASDKDTDNEAEIKCYNDKELRQAVRMLTDKSMNYYSKITIKKC